MKNKKVKILEFGPFRSSFAQNPLEIEEIHLQIARSSQHNNFKEKKL